MEENDLYSNLQKMPGDHKVEYCHQCGKCSSGCPVTNFFDFRPRRIVAMVQLGLIEELLKSDEIWKCAQCLACKERCPRDVAPYDVIQSLQNLTFRNNLTFPKNYSVLINSILKNGFIQKPIRVKTGVINKSSTKEDKVKKFEFCDRTSLKLPDSKKPIEFEKFTTSLKKTLKGDQR